MEETLSTPQGSTIPTQAMGIGARLKATREVLRLSEKEAAARLNLSTKLIEIMETENFTAGPPPTFMRGYLRSYGRLLNFNENEINLAISEMSIAFPIATTAIQPTIKKIEAQKLDRFLGWSSYLVIGLLFGLVVIWWTSHPRFNEIETITKQMADAAPTTSAPLTIASTTTTTAPAASTPNITTEPSTVLAQTQPPHPVNETKNAITSSALNIASSVKAATLGVTDKSNSDNNDDVEDIY